MKAIINIILMGILVLPYWYYEKETKPLTDYDIYGKITKVEILRPLDSIGAKAMIWRWSKFPKRGQIRIITLEKYYRLGEKLEKELKNGNN